MDIDKTGTVYMENLRSVDTEETDREATCCTLYLSLRGHHYTSPLPVLLLAMQYSTCVRSKSAEPSLRRSTVTLSIIIGRQER